MKIEKMIIKSLFVMGFALVSNLQANDIRYLTVNGEVDPRIGIEFEVIY